DRAECDDTASILDANCGAVVDVLSIRTASHSPHLACPYGENGRLIAPYTQFMGWSHLSFNNPTHYFSSMA
ncbi:MAG TPA: hypothetical protein VGV14_19560, partial [Rhodanobacter sp.]|nr:hypothetical protein [Rhodanobacter sp.]